MNRSEISRWKYEYLLRAYSRGGADDAAGFTSPLDIPGATVWRALLLALAICIVAGSLVIYGLRFWVGAVDLPSIEKENRTTGFVGLTRSSTSREAALGIGGILLPHWKYDMGNADTVIQSAIDRSFREDAPGSASHALTVETLSRFIKNTQSLGNGPVQDGFDFTDVDELQAKLIGSAAPSPWTLFLIPQFDPISADKLADRAGLLPSLKEELGKKDNPTWRRFVFMSAVQALRDQMDNGLSKPRRLILALGGAIQWLTFIAAVWCLLLLGWLRLPWIKLQSKLADSKGLPFTGQGSRIWDLNSQEYARLDIGGIEGLRSFGQNALDEGRLARLFIVPRLIKDCIRLNKDTSATVEQNVRERTSAYRDAVDVGEYEMINFLMWAAPTFGFIGTIFGIIGAMESAASIFSAATPVEQGIALDKVSGSLGTAFDTTFVALIWLIPMTFVLARVRKLEANFFQTIEQNGVSELPGQFKHA